MRKKKNEQKKSTAQRLNEQKKEKRMKKFKKIKFFLKVIFLIGLLIGLMAYALTSPIFNITEIEINGNKKIDKETYVELSGLKLDDNIFNFTKAKVIKKIKQNAYVEKVIIKRKLPTKIEIQIEERVASYLIELENQEFAYINNQGYILEKSKEELDLTMITGISTSIENIIEGNRLKEEDLERLQYIIQIKDAINNAGIDKKISKIDVTSRTNCILTLEKEAKEVHIGSVNDNLSGKLLYMKYLLEQEEGVPGTIYLNQSQVYFSPK